MFLTNDGAFANTLTHPRYEVEKEYEVMTEAPISARDARALAERVELSDGPGAFLSIRPLAPAPSGHSRYAVVVGEGRNRFIRRMFEAIGNAVYRLVRVRVGSLELGELASGELRPLGADEIARLLQSGHNADQK